MNRRRRVCTLTAELNRGNEETDESRGNRKSDVKLEASILREMKVINETQTTLLLQHRGRYKFHKQWTIIFLLTGKYLK